MFGDWSLINEEFEILISKMYANLDGFDTDDYYDAMDIFYNDIIRTPSLNPILKMNL